MNRIAIIILNYNTWEDTLKEMEMVHNICKVNYQDFIIVDNASPNDSLKNLRKNSEKGFVLLTSSKNKGYAAGNNIGLRYASENNYDYAWIFL